MTETTTGTTTTGTATPNRYLTGNYAPVAAEVTALDLPVIGELPAELNGRYLRNGPNPIGAVDDATHHWFVGDGMVHGVRLREGRAEWYRNRYVGSAHVAEVRGLSDIAGTHYQFQRYLFRSLGMPVFGHPIEREAQSIAGVSGGANCVERHKQHVPQSTGLILVYLKLAILFSPGDTITPCCMR